MKRLYKDFADSADVFYRAKEYWHELFTTCAVEAGESNSWADWFSPHEFELNFAPDSAIRIFSAINRNESRGLSVSMLNTESNKETIGAYTDIFGESTDSPVWYLTISCILTDKTSLISENLLKAWINPDITQELMDAHINKYVPRNSAQSSDNSLS